MKIRPFETAVLGLVLAVALASAQTAAAAFTFATNSFGTGYAACFGTPRNFSLGLPSIVSNQATFAQLGLCGAEGYGVKADVQALSLPSLGASATDRSGDGSGVSAFIAEGVLFAGVPAGGTARFTFEIKGSFTGSGDDMIDFAAYNANGTRRAHLDLTLDTGSPSISMLIQDAVNPSGALSTIPGTSFDVFVSFDLQQSDLGFFAELFAGAFLLEGLQTTANAHDTATLVSVNLPQGGSVTLGSGQTFSAQVPEPSTLGLASAGLAGFVGMRWWGRRRSTCATTS